MRDFCNFMTFWRRQFNVIWNFSLVYQILFPTFWQKFIIWSRDLLGILVMFWNHAHHFHAKIKVQTLITFDSGLLWLWNFARICHVTQTFKSRHIYVVKTSWRHKNPSFWRFFLKFLPIWRFIDVLMLDNDWIHLFWLKLMFSTGE